MTRILIENIGSSSMQPVADFMARQGFHFSSYGEQGGVKLGLVHNDKFDFDKLRKLAEELAAELKEPRLSMSVLIR